MISTFNTACPLILEFRKTSLVIKIHRFVLDHRNALGVRVYRLNDIVLFFLQVSNLDVIYVYKQNNSIGKGGLIYHRFDYKSFLISTHTSSLRNCIVYMVLLSPTSCK